LSFNLERRLTVESWNPLEFPPARLRKTFNPGIRSGEKKIAGFGPEAQIQTQLRIRYALY
jgi:hypothetical protein